MAATPSPQTQLALTTVASPHPRRLPPPCWSHDETAALIDAYREKWYSLRRGNLRANHWQEVADAVATVCPVDPVKTPVQCRHKMEKLRKRYRNDLIRSSSRPSGVHRPVSSWVHFDRMHDMERRPEISHPDSRADLGNIAAEDDGEEDEDEELYQSIRQGVPNNNSFRLKSASFGSKPSFGVGTRAVVNEFKENNFANYDPRSSFGGASGRVVGNGYKEKEAKKRGREKEVAEALRGLGEGYVRVERMKMEMAREVETMRMDMEMKRTEMILESQQQIVLAFASAISEDKRNKRMGSPES